MTPNKKAPVPAGAHQSNSALHYSPSFAQYLKAAVDIVTVIGDRVPLKKRGAYTYIGLCPFHQEKTGSFNVHQQKQFFKCFGCGVSGDVIKFEMEYENVTFLEAIVSLSERYGIAVGAPAAHRERRLYARRIEGARELATAIVGRRDAYLLDLQTAAGILFDAFHRAERAAMETQDVDLAARAEAIFAKLDEITDRRDRLRRATGGELVEFFATFGAEVAA